MPSQRTIGSFGTTGAAQTKDKLKSMLKDYPDNLPFFDDITGLIDVECKKCQCGLSCILAAALEASVESRSSIQKAHGWLVDIIGLYPLWCGICRIDSGPSFVEDVLSIDTMLCEENEYINTFTVKEQTGRHGPYSNYLNDFMISGISRGLNCIYADASDIYKADLIIRFGAKEVIAKCLQRAQANAVPRTKRHREHPRDFTRLSLLFFPNGQFDMGRWNSWRGRLQELHMTWDPAPTEANGPFPQVVLSTVIAAYRAMKDVERELLAHLHESK
ncbi:hypothetical protein LIA77_07814 [Sarocladium implicatum]|nr:hypothetical protein LIA77_07814 [Sarocladium implicatum]